MCHLPFGIVLVRSSFEEFEQAGVCRFLQVAMAGKSEEPSELVEKAEILLDGPRQKKSSFEQKIEGP